MSRTKKKVSAFAVIEIIFIIILVLVMIAMLSFNFLFKKNNTASSVFGYSLYNTKAVNMLPDFPENTVVIAKKSEIQNVKEGSVILCNIGDYTTLIRVTQIQQEADKTYYVVKFDTSSANETFRIESDAVIAKAVWQINGFGKFLDFATSTVGIIIAVIIPLIFIIAIQIARILSIHKLEDEADALEDIDDIIQARNIDEHAPVTFSEPKFVEDITGKLPVINRENEVLSDKVLSVDNRGRAEYTERKQQDVPDSGFPLFSYEALKKPQQNHEPVVAGISRNTSEDDFYMNRPTRINSEMQQSNSFLERDFSRKTDDSSIITNENESVVFTPHLSNIIPESIAAVQEETSSPKKNGFDDSVKAYFERKTEPESETEPEEALIPAQAVKPKETIAPPKKNKNNKALAELMSIIDAEETKIKK